MKIYTKLAAIQAALKAPKSQFNKFGGYSYRKAEDILEAVKPLLKDQGCILTCTDELIQVGDRFYIKATATITAIEDGSQVLTTAFAREEEEKKGMDGSQVTGASSSYARKYALNGLLCIDDTADSDTTNQGDTDKAATAGKGGTQRGRKPAAAAQAPAPQGQLAGTGTNPVPARDSDTWSQWVEAIATGKPGKSGERQDWLAVFKATYACTQDDVDVLEEQVFNYRMRTGARAQQ